MFFFYLTKIYFPPFKEKLKRRLDNVGEFEANSDLIDAMVKIDGFQRKFIDFCNKRDICQSLVELIESQISKMTYEWPSYLKYNFKKLITSFVRVLCKVVFIFWWLCACFYLSCLLVSIYFFTLIITNLDLYILFTQHLSFSRM